jgi:drug/metabolite transporter (DMT)-like permease
VPERQPFHFTRRQSILLVFFCTVFGAAAQIFFKFGAGAMQRGAPLALVTDPTLLTGCALYGVSSALLVLALKDGELSILYPVISLTYIWVTFLSVLFFKESLTLCKMAGVLVIVGGVVLLGRGQRS